MALSASWSSLITDWTRALKAENKSPRTIGIYTSAARKLGEYLDEHSSLPVEPDEVNKAHVRDFIGWVVESTSPGNAHTNYRSLQQWFKFLIDEEEIDESADPMARMKPPIVPEKPVPVVPDDLMGRVLKTCEGKDFQSRRDTAIIRMIWDTGARLSEIANLTLDDVDLTTDTIHVIGKGRRPRAIPISPKTGQAISRYLRARAKHKLADSDRLWLGIKNRPPMNPNGVVQMLARRGKEAGVNDAIGRNLHAHLGRHSAAHHWQAQGGSEGDMMRVFGWKSPQMPKRYGASAADERAQAAARNLRLGDRI